MSYWNNAKICQHEGTSLDYMMARYYGPEELFRFVSVDPSAGAISLARPSTWNRYGYVGNNPILMVDPFGLTEYVFVLFPTDQSIITESKARQVGTTMQGMFDTTGADVVVVMGDQFTDTAVGEGDGKTTLFFVAKPGDSQSGHGGEMSRKNDQGLIVVNDSNVFTLAKTGAEEAYHNIVDCGDECETNERTNVMGPRVQDLEDEIQKPATFDPEQREKLREAAGKKGAEQQGTGTSSPGRNGGRHTTVTDGINSD